MFVKATVLFLAFKSDRRGFAAFEYAMLAALMAAVITGVVSSLGGTLSAAFNSIASSVRGAS